MSHPLKIKEFRTYWIGQIISLTGTWMQHIAQSWLVYIITKSAFYLGLISFLSSFPTLIFTLFGGVVADRYPRRNILIATQCLSCLPAIVLGFLIQFDLINIWHIAIASVILGVASAFDMPARQAFITEIVSPDMITKALAMQSISFNIARVAGPILAGFIVTNLNFYACFYLNALSFLPLILILLNIKTSFVLSSKEDSSFIKSFKEGFFFLNKNKEILYIIFAVGIFTLFGLSYMTIIPVIAGEILDVGAKGFGIIVSAIGVGALLAGVIITLKKDIREKLKYIFKASLLFSFALLGIAFSEDFYSTILLNFIIGFALVNFFIISNSFIQQKTEQRLRGRVMSFFTLVFLGFTPIGNLFTGFLVERFGVKPVVELYSLICLISGVVFLKILPSTLSRKQ
ncbi:MAG: MFS transporter [Thermodesulfovibrio sp.]